MRQDSKAEQSAWLSAVVNMRAVQIGGIVLFFALIGAALGLGFFRQVDGQNLKTLVRENLALKQQVAQDDRRIKGLESSEEDFRKILDQRDERIKKLEKTSDAHGRDLIGRSKQLKELREVSKRELAQRDRRIKELEMEAENRR